MLKRIKRIIFPALFFLSVLFLAEGGINARRGGDFLGSLTIVSEEGFDSGIAEAAAEDGGRKAHQTGKNRRRIILHLPLGRSLEMSRYRTDSAKGHAVRM